MLVRLARLEAARRPGRWCWSSVFSPLSHRRRRRNNASASPWRIQVCERALTFSGIPAAAAAAGWERVRRLGIRIGRRRRRLTRGSLAWIECFLKTSTTLAFFFFFFLIKRKKEIWKKNRWKMEKKKKKRATDFTSTYNKIIISSHNLEFPKVWDTLSKYSTSTHRVRYVTPFLVRVGTECLPSQT